MSSLSPPPPPPPPLECKFSEGRDSIIDFIVVKHLERCVWLLIHCLHKERLMLNVELNVHIWNCCFLYHNWNYLFVNCFFNLSYLLKHGSHMRVYICVCVCVCVYIYIYITHIHTTLYTVFNILYMTDVILFYWTFLSDKLM